MLAVFVLPTWLKPGQLALSCDYNLLDAGDMSKALVWALVMSTHFCVKSSQIASKKHQNWIQSPNRRLFP